ncbi:hypothetical protein BAUCODRAFT_331958 [Baudoinia panamericana UAMH 10762]|uniref:Uncharacterized protein n=1 Tax=Baudoinia panamericana (strain UAMH 10762) TaxID=717646 RepID=M2M330_BAUPA|nr:uncharacterized protein BAUCODRAFT_331958 [Baudoinia panamericana UAMH 10762]EMC90941.1 hypothetical protein BAUCODRAFT_331958 [Baudoinia panamericana UAMH 10762]
MVVTRPPKCARTLGTRAIMCLKIERLLANVSLGKARATQTKQGTTRWIGLQRSHTWFAVRRKMYRLAVTVAYITIMVNARLRRSRRSSDDIHVNGSILD